MTKKKIPLKDSHNIALEETRITHILGNHYLPFLGEQSESLREAVRPLLHDLGVLHRRDMTSKLFCN